MILCMRFERKFHGKQIYALHSKFLRVNHTFKHIHVIQKMSCCPTNCLQSSLKNVHNLVPMEILLDNGHWVHLAGGHPPLGQVHPMAII